MRSVQFRKIMIYYNNKVESYWDCKGKFQVDFGNILLKVKVVYLNFELEILELFFEGFLEL